ncbi:MAG: protein kinase [Polyangiales bacterium]
MTNDAATTLVAISKRFEVIRELGRGGMGVVLEAFDAARGLNVALKLIPDGSAQGTLALKREFRVLADLQHPNLVRLLDLVVQPQGSFFTMELIDGVDFLEHCRPGGDLRAAPHESTIVARTLGSSGWTDGDDAAQTDTHGDAGVTRVDDARLRRAVEQLVHGLSALHAEGLVHRDLKPNNCMVSRGGRVVLLDFGLVQPVATELGSRSGRIVGTVAYMAPEQARGETHLGPAADWYALGVMLYEALSGVRPFEGNATSIIVAKLTAEPRPLHELAPEVAPDLAELSMALLARDPAARPDAAAILARLTGARASLPPGPRGAPLVQRDKELAALEDILARLARGRGAIVLIRGVSGAGKSALVTRALQAFGAKKRAVVLTGRCYPREVVPFNAFDRVIDQLVTAHSERVSEVLRALGGEDVAALARIFPALSALVGFHADTTEPLGVEARQHTRDRAFRAVRKLLSGLAAYCPVVISLDDVQWADADSLALAGALANTSSLGGVGLLVSYRQADEAPPRFASLLRRAINDASLRWEFLELPVGPLDHAAAVALAASLLGDDSADSARLADSIATAAEGLPIGIVELARLVRAEAEAGRAIDSVESVDHAIRTRFSRLSPAASRLLHLVAVSEGPLPLKVARRALGDVEEDDPTAVLTGNHWVREDNVGGTLMLDTQHDRLREVVGGTLTAELRRDYHQRLAQALEVEEPTMHEHLAHHHAEAGHRTLAVAHARTAAEQAMQQLAFDRAAKLLGRAASLASEGERGRLAVQLVQALVAAGRGSEAAALALPAAAGRTDQDARDLRRLAAEGLLQTGRVDAALDVYRSVARDEAITLPRGKASTLTALLAARATLALRSEVPAGQDDEKQRRRIDVLTALSAVLLLIDPLSGALIHTRRLLLARQYGDARQLAIALASEGAMRSAMGNRVRGAAIIADAQQRAEASGDPYAISAALFARGILAYTEWRLTDAERDLHESEAVLLGAATGASWELTTGRLFRYFSAIAGGRYRSALHDLAEHREDARRRRDSYATAVLGTACAAFQHLAVDQPAGAHQALDEALDGWPAEPFLLPHLLEAVTRAVVYAYERRFAEAYRLAVATHKRAQRAGLLRHQINRARVDQLVACCAARHGDTRRATRHARALLDQPLGGLGPAGHMVLGALAAEAGDHVGAERALRAAVDGLMETEFGSWRAAACAALAELVSADEAAALREVADQWVSAEGIVAPHRLYAVFVPWSVFDRVEKEETA